MQNLKLSFSLLIITQFVLMFSYAQDWANLDRYKVENSKLKSFSQDERRVVFMGNSITEEWLKFCPDFFVKRNYINRGISGQTTPQMLIRFRPDVIDLKPKLVIILAGTNDIAGNTGPIGLEETFGNIVSMAELAKSNDIKVILASILPVYDFPWSPGIEPAEKIFSLNKMIKKYADKNDLIYLDYYSSMVDEKKGLKSAYSTDGVHPNKAGYKIMIPLAEQAIVESLKQR